MKKNRHHRKPKSKGGGNNKRNIVQVPMDKHIAYHVLFGTMTPEEVGAELTRTWIDPDYEIIVRRR